MATNLTLVFGTYTFPNQTFQIVDHRISPDTPVAPIPRRDGGEVLVHSLTPRGIRINGRLFGTDKNSVHNELNVLMKSMHNAGAGASLFYRADRFVYAELAQGGLVGQYEDGLYEHVILVDMTMVSKNPYAEGVAQGSASGSRSNSCGTVSVTPDGIYPTQAVWTFVAGHTFTGGIRVDNVLNSMSFVFSGPMTPGQTLVVDNVLGCVLLQVGLTMVDAMTLFGGDAFLELAAGVQNDLVVCAPTLNFSMVFRPRYYA